jgi:hypothetical protein
MNKPALIVIPMLMTIWVGTSGLNWVNSYYIHVHLISAASIFFAFYFFGRMITSDCEEAEYGFLGALSLCVYGVSRVESPIFIGIFLAMLLGVKSFSRKEILATFFLPILVEIIWLLYLLFVYFGYESPSWSDSRIILALGAYILFALFIVIFMHKNNLQDFAQKYITKIVFVLLINASLLLIILKPDHQITNSIAIIRHLFQGEIWGYYWWENLMIIFSLIIINNIIKKIIRFSKAMKFIGMMILVYLLLILDVGFIRRAYYGYWPDSASRMFSHISPITGFYMCVFIIENVPRMNIFQKQV